jgi:hypothetical protein
MKRIAILAITLLLLGGAAYLVVNKQKELKFSSGVTADRDFAIPSLDGITNIVLKHAKLQPTQFQRKGNSWVINNKYEANEVVMRNLTDVLTKMQLKYTPPKNTTATIKEEIKRSGIKVQLYAGSDKPIKTYYIASDTEKQEGTFMLMEGGEQVYVMHLPYLNGGFRSRFEQPLDRLRDIYVYKENPEDITSIIVQYPKKEEMSFTLNKSGDSYIVKPLLSNLEPLHNINQAKARNYVYGFASIGAEVLINDYEYKDSILKTIPFCIIELTNAKGFKTKAKYYPYGEFVEKMNIERTDDDIASTDKYFIWVNEKDLFFGQHQLFKKAFGTYDGFFTK